MNGQKVIPLKPARPQCGVRGLVQAGAMCGWILVGLMECGYRGSCAHQGAKKPQAD